MYNIISLQQTVHQEFIVLRLIQEGMYDRQQPVLCSAVGMGVPLEFRVRKLSLTKKLAVILRTGNHTRGA